MPEPFSEDRLSQLEERWHRDPGSRIFLQLAEELRRGGRLERAVEVLRGGLARHPSYLSAQVALGRCLVEQGDAVGAVAMLERAVAQDPTQLVASRLLIDAYLRCGDAANARNRLDLYRIFADRPEEIRALEARIRQLEATLGIGAPAEEAKAPQRGGEPAAELFQLAGPAVPFAFSPAPRRPVVRDAHPFGSLAPRRDAAARFAAACRLEGLFPVAPAAAAVLEPEPVAPELAIAQPLAEPPAVSAAASAFRPIAAPEPVMSPEPVPIPFAEPEPIPPATPPWGGGEQAAAMALESQDAVFGAPPFSPREIGAEVERETIEEPYDELFSAVPAAPAPPVAALPGSASATLGELYLSQGHLAEAESAFREVLAVRPADSAAERGLREVARRRAQVAAAAHEETAAGWEPLPPPVAPATPVVGPPVVGRRAQRKVEVLRAYLSRIRRGAGDRVP